MTVMEQFLSWNVSRELITVLISALPIVELRGALPVAIYSFDMPWYKAYYLSVIGNLLPVPLLLFLLERLAKVISLFKGGKMVVDWVFEHTRRRGRMIEKYEKIGLMLFVAIPSPFTGAWTGSIAAFLLGLKVRYAFLSVSLGVIIAGAIVTCLCLLGWVGAVIAGVGLSAVATIGWIRN